MNANPKPQNPGSGRGMLPLLTSVMLLLTLVLLASVLRERLQREKTEQLLNGFDLERVLSDIERYHVRGLTRDEVIEGILTGLAERLDRYARCYTPDELKSHMDEMEGSFTGVGIRVVKIGKYITVVHPIRDTAAEKAGIKTGDRLVEADGHSLVDLPLEEAVKYLRGPVNSLLELKVLREGSEDPVAVKIVRAPVPSTSLSYPHMVSDEVGYIRVEEFTRSTADDLKREVKRLEEKGLKALILDLRHNGGGLLNSGIAVADLFLSKGIIVTVKNGRQDHPDLDIYKAAAGDELEGLPLVVLVDGRTASASEILAAALQDHGRARVIGTKTYGKGTVQQLFTEGLGGFGLKFTVAYFYTPSGKRIDGEGVTPDVEVKQSEDDLAKALLRYSTEEIRAFLPDYEPDLSQWKMSLKELLSFPDAMIPPALKALSEPERKTRPLPTGVPWEPIDTGTAQ